MRSIELTVCLAGLLVVLLCTPQCHAQAKTVKLTNEWKGSVADESQMKGAPECITSAKALEQLWKAWKIEDKMPKVDFDKEIVVIAVTSGSKISLSARLDDKGNLEVLGQATRDLRPGFRYVLGTVSREGVKTVNKKELPKE
jgi:hypothetical protein